MKFKVTIISEKEAEIEAKDGEDAIEIATVHQHDDNWINTTKSFRAKEVKNG